MQWSAERNAYIDPNGSQDSSGNQPQAWRSLLARAAIFFVVFAALQLSWEALRGSAFEYAVIHDGTVRPAAFLIHLISPSLDVHSVKFSLRAPGGGLNLRNGCEGMETLFLLLAAFLVAPIPWRSRLLGLLLGIPVVFAVNQARVLVLFYAYRANHAWFDPLHGTVTPIAVILLVCAYFYTWLVRAARSPSSPA